MQSFPLSPVVFYVFASLAIAFSLLVVLKKNPVSSAFSLVMVFFCFAGIYAGLQAHLIAAMQVLVYAGAIMVLFIFVIMLLNADEPTFDLVKTNPVIKISAALFTLILLACFIVAFKKSPAPEIQAVHTEAAIQSVGGNSKAIAQLIFSKYILPFELTSVLLLVGIVGAVALAKRKPNKHVILKGAQHGSR